jgi:hypothetical protein
LDSPLFFERTIYWSEGDERAHFEWLDRIDAIKSVVGKGDRLYLEVDAAVFDASHLRELQAVYRRYGADLGQLDKLKVAVNAQD